MTKWELALRKLDCVREYVTFGVVLAAAGYGVNARFRQALSARVLFWSGGITRTQTVYPAEVRLSPILRHFRGRRPKYPTTSRPFGGRASAERSRLAQRNVDLASRHQGALSGRFAAVYVRLADGKENSQCQHLPRQAA
ncbi:hypothetical protein EHF33_19110 (plasmid) [Deinococcus psychrotolerans]|uniref:Transposase IS701-like DDE domain-containing protein n=1 Tax=Deinococcus psychrotolerans TaxID=2489213 RepID=A0A3G8YIA1_9DEIO|nr:hypothetical protein EHF33_19110 [Deinococcus psychrotolerans]